MCNGQDELSRVSGQRWGPAGQRDSTAKDLDVRVAGPSGSGISVVWSKAGRDPGGGALQAVPPPAWRRGWTRAGALPILAGSGAQK